MAERAAGRARGLLLALAAVAALAPVATLAVRAVADEWRAPALVPQRIGTRAITAAFADGSGTAQAIANSLAVGVMATLLALAIGWPAARALGEGRLRRPGPVWLLLALPLLVPQYATGLGLTEWFIRLGLADTLRGLVIAHLVPVLPYVVIVLASGFTERVRDLEEAARVLGAGPVRRLAVVTLPAMAPTVAVAALLGFLVSWSQYGLSLAVGGGIPMLPLLLVPFVGGDPQVAAVLALVFLLPAVAALAVASGLIGGRGAGG